MRSNIGFLGPLALSALLGCSPNPLGGGGLFDLDGDGFGNAVDCDDANADINPMAEERCDGKTIDQDCDGQLDDDDDDGVANPTEYFRDQDSDGFGDPDVSEFACEPPDGFLADDSDCDDDAPTVYPGAPELCATADDDDCDGNANDDDDDATDRQAWFTDADNDGYGAPGDSVLYCDPPNDVADNDDDCDDDARLVNPGMDEECDDDDTDEDCDGASDDADPEGASGLLSWYADADGDGYGDGGRRQACEPQDGEVDNDDDCDDAAATVNPDGTEVCDDGVDQDCDGNAFPCVVEETVDASAGSLVIGPSGAELGSAIAAGGDTNGDGVAELWLGGPEYAPGGDATGLVVGLSGRLGAQSDSSDVAIASLSASVASGFGATLASGYDLDGDGLDDLAVSDCNPTSTYDESTVYLFNGPVAATNTDAGAFATRSASASSDGIGWGLALGDYNGDGIGDLFTAEWADNQVYGELGPISSGAYYGSSLDDVYVELGPGAHLALGDLTGDGAEELGVASYGSNVVNIYSGGETGTLSSSDRESYLAATTAQAFGFALSLRGDVNEDGDNDLFVGAPDADSDAGAVYIFYGPLDSTLDEGDADITVLSTEAGTFCGYSLALAEDLNGDEEPDLAMGCPLADGAKVDRGEVWLYSDLSAGSFDENDRVGFVRGESSYTFLGVSLGVADIDDDGLDDLAIGGLEFDGAGNYGGGVSVFYGATY